MLSKVKIFSTLIFVLFLLFGYTNCGQINLDSTQTGNPGDPPSPGEGQVRSSLVMDFVSNICTQQFERGVSTDFEACKEQALLDNALAREIYVSDPNITFQTLIDSEVLGLDLISRINARACNEQILGSSVQTITGVIYSSDTAIGAVNSIDTCNEYFITTVPETLACLTTQDLQDGSLLKPWLISDCECFQEIQTNPRDSQKTDQFLLTDNIDCSAVSEQEAGAGFISIQNFEGTLDGNGKQIQNLSSKRDYASVFSFKLGTIRNLSFSNISLDSRSNPSGVSALAIHHGSFANPIDFIDNIQILSGSYQADLKTGHAYGLADYVGNRVNQSSVNLTLTANNVAGIAGRTYDPTSTTPQITNTNYSGLLRGRERYAGIVIYNHALISNCSASILTNVTETNSGFYFGGLVTHNHGGIVSNSQSSGNVNLNYAVNTSVGAIYGYQFGSLASVNLTYNGTPGQINESSSSINYNIIITRSPGATDAMNNLGIYDMVGSNSASTTNINFTGSGSYSFP